jgi:ribonucleoside-diphosphate reductase alpha chain
MVILDVDHPDIEEFVETKAREEDKIRALRDAGFDMDLGGKDIVSVQYQNANNSVRVTDEFMRAVEQGSSFGLKARATGEVIETVDAKSLWTKLATAAWECADPGIQYDDTINDWHTNPETGRITASNPCSEYMSLDNSSCNLASLNLMKFLRDDGTFEAKKFAKAVEIIITAMDISICFADFPTLPIAETTRAYRQLGIGYANLGALLMATGHAYDSDGGRALAGAITSLMTGTAYKRSAELAAIVGPYDGYARNAEPHKRVMRKHAAANDAVRAVGADDARILHEATKAWQECLALGEKNGYRNAQASVIAPTGCLTGDTLVTTDRGLTRLDQLGDIYGEQWQEAGFHVSTDEGPRQATKFFVNGEEETRRIVTAGGYTIQGTLAHRVKVVDQETGEWTWVRLAEIEEGDIVPIQMDTLVGRPRRVPLPLLDQAYYAGDRNVVVPDAVDADLAELVGYFMGDGSLHAKGLRFCVANTDLDVVDRLRILGKGLFNLEPTVGAKEGYQEVILQSVRLVRWWQAAGFAKTLPSLDHVGKGWVPRVPAAILESNDKDVYAAFLRGLFEADGTVLGGVPSVSTAKRSFAAEIQALLLTLGLPSTVRETVSGFGGASFQVRLRNNELAVMFGDIVGFLGDRKARLLETDPSQPGNRDRVMLPRAVWDELVPVGHPLRGEVVQNLNRANGIPRSTAEGIYRETRDPRIKHALDYVFEKVTVNEDGGVQPTYDLSVPDNVTYVANGFVSHNTIGLMMDCDTTGLEPDLALVKFKKLVGGASMQIVNGTVPRALRALGYQEESVEAIVEHIAEKGNVIDAPGLKPEHYSVFDCAMGDRSISPMGHVRMMAAIQPGVSGALSKTVNVPAEATVDDIAEVYFQGWKLGLKALAIYRNNSKVGQPLQDKKGSEKDEDVLVATRPVRKRLPKSRTGRTISFSIAGAEGYMTANAYEDGTLGEVFIKMSKQGSTLAGVMDAFSVSISIALQYGVPLETYVAKFTNMRFDPAGMTDDADIRIAQSVMDYLFRRLALDFLPYDKRAELGIFTAEERAATVAAGYGSAPVVEDEVDVEGLAQGVPVETHASAAPATVHSSMELIEAQQGSAADAPLCMTCGVKMRPAGSCYVCESCGSTSGCS